MTFDQFYSSCLSQVWRLMQNVHIPTLGISFADIMIGTIGIYISLFILRNLSGLAGIPIGLASWGNAKYQSKLRRQYDLENPNSFESWKANK